jgi:hypothetical protein
MVIADRSAVWCLCREGSKAGSLIRQRRRSQLAWREQEMAECAHCGAVLNQEPTTRFCENCGKPLSQHGSPGTAIDREYGNASQATGPLDAVQSHIRLGPKNWRTLLVAFFAASTSGAAILLYAAGWVTLTYSVTFLAPLSALIFVALLVGSGRGREDVFLNRMWGGLIAGAAGLLAYDGIRWLILLTDLVPFNPFRAIEVYGLLILDQYEDTFLTKTVGWAFHLWNGLSFALMYTLAVGRGRVLWALGWGMILEISMLATYPSIFRLVLDWAFVGVSLTGHVAYGLALGVVAKRLVKW